MSSKNQGLNEETSDEVNANEIRMRGDEIENLSTASNDEQDKEDNTSTFEGEEEEEKDDKEYTVDTKQEENKNEEENYFKRIELPLYTQLKKPLGKLRAIPEDYNFENLDRYQSTMLKLEREHYFKQFRKSLNEELLSKDMWRNPASSTFNEFQLIKDFEIGDISFEISGFTIEVRASMSVPRYQKEQWEIINNQLLFFVHKHTKKIYLGKSQMQKNEYTSEVERIKKNFNDMESYTDGQTNLRFDELTKAQKNKEEEEELDDFEIIKFTQTFKIRMDVFNPSLNDLFQNFAKISEDYLLVSPHEYWGSLEYSLNCKKQFKELNGIAFPEQTLFGEKGTSSFPKYEFLEHTGGDNSALEHEIENELIEEKELDSYQRTALIHALNNENTVIQGPPGTGKTFLACRLVNILNKIYNKHTRKPILVLSKKNLSLDSLLEKILESNPKTKILRLGQRSESEIIQKLTVQNQEGPSKKPPVCKIPYTPINQQLKKFQERKRLRIYQQKYFSEEEIKMSRELLKFLKNKFIELLSDSLDIDLDEINESTKTDFFLDWLNDEIDEGVQVKNYLKHANIKLSHQEMTLLDELVENQQENDDEIEIRPTEQEVMRYVNQFESFDEFTSNFAKYLVNNQETMETDLIISRMRIFENNMKKSRSVSESEYQKELGLFMEKYEVIGMTFSGYHMHFEALQKLGAEIVIIEEASEIIESEFYPILTPGLKHLIQIGDHQQLRPIVKDHTLEYKYNYRFSYFERLVSKNEMNYVTLYNQRRMLPQFANFTRLFYGDKYLDDVSTRKREMITQISKDGMYMLQHSFPDKQQTDNSFINLYEAFYVKDLVNYLVNKFKVKEEKISVITTYKSQRILIKSLLNKQKKQTFTHGKGKNLVVQDELKELKDVEVYTIDKFQGNENDIIILSCVRSNMDMKCGFVLNDHRINVAFSRARRGFFCIGNFEQYKLRSSTWKSIVNLSKKQFSYSEIIPSPLYKNIDRRVQDALSKQNPRGYNPDLFECNLCGEESHMSVCDYDIEEINSRRDYQKEEKGLNVIWSLIQLQNDYQKMVSQLMSNQQLEIKEKVTQMKQMYANAALESKKNKPTQPGQQKLKANEKKLNQFSKDSNLYNKPVESNTSKSPTSSQQQVLSIQKKLEQDQFNLEDETHEESKVQYFDSQKMKQELPCLADVVDDLIVAQDISSEKITEAYQKKPKLAFQISYEKDEKNNVSHNQWDPIGKKNVEIQQYNDNVEYVNDKFKVNTNPKLSQKEKKKQKNTKN